MTVSETMLIHKAARDKAEEIAKRGLRLDQRGSPLTVADLIADLSQFDADSFVYVDGCTIDYIEELNDEVHLR